MTMIDLGTMELGEKFATERNRQIDSDNVVNVRRIVQQAHAEGLLDDSAGR
jgi:hypothetical protein